MPPGTIGFRAGEVTRDEYRDIPLPPIRKAAEAGDVLIVRGLDGLEEAKAWVAR